MKVKEKIEYIKKNNLQSKIGRKPIIFVDQDDVCNNFIEQVIIEFNEKKGTNYTEDNVTDWDIGACLKAGNADIFNDMTIFSRLKVREGCYENFKLLYESGLFEMYMLSAAHPYAMPYKFDWLIRKLPFFDTRRYLTGMNKGLYHGDILLDDGLHNIEAFKHGEAVIFSRPHNRKYDGPEKRVETWEEFANYILDKFYM